MSLVKKTRCPMKKRAFDKLNEETNHFTMVCLFFLKTHCYSINQPECCITKFRFISYFKEGETSEPFNKI